MKRIGIDIGGTNIKAGIVDEKGNIIVKSSIKTDEKCDYVKMVSEVYVQICDLLKEAGLKETDLCGIGVGVPGSVDSKSGVVGYANNLNWNNIPLGAEFSKHTKLSVKVGNDANVAALGEAVYGAGKKYKDIIMLTLGTGVGGGIIIDKKVYDGNKGMGAELGHAVIELNGEQCTCGRKGCIEAYVSATALVRDTKRKMLKCKDSAMWGIVDGDIDKVTAKTAFDCAKKGDVAASEVVENYVYYLVESILNYANIFRPEAIVLGGGVCYEKEYLTDKLIAQCEAKFYGYKGTPKVAIETAELKNDAGIIGAAALIEI